MTPSKNKRHFRDVYKYRIDSGEMIFNIERVVGINIDVSHVLLGLIAGCRDSFIHLFFFKQLSQTQISLFISYIHAMTRRSVHIKIEHFFITRFVYKPILGQRF